MTFNHLTLNSNHLEVHDIDDIFINQEAEKEALELFDRIMENNDNLVHVLDDIYARGIICDYGYAITLSNENNIPLIETMGFYDEETMHHVLDANNFNNSGFFPGRYRILKGPTVCDIIMPSIVVASHVVSWSGDFCKCMGAIFYKYK